MKPSDGIFILTGKGRTHESDGSAGSDGADDSAGGGGAGCTAAGRGRQRGNGIHLAAAAIYCSLSNQPGDPEG